MKKLKGERRQGTKRRQVTAATFLMGSVKSKDDRSKDRRTFENPNYREIRLREDGTLDEVVAGFVPRKPGRRFKSVFFHLEQMDTGHWWMRIDFPDGRGIVVNLTSRGKIKASAHEE